MSNELKVLREFIKEFSPFHQSIARVKDIEDMTYVELTKVVKEIAKEM